MKVFVFMLAVATAAIFPNPVSAETKIRIGHFPNITHAQGVIAHAMSRQGKGWFEQNAVKAGFIRTAPDLSQLFENP